MQDECPSRGGAQREVGYMYQFIRHCTGVPLYKAKAFLTLVYWTYTFRNLNL